MWPYIEEYGQTILKGTIEPLLQSSLPGPFKNISFTSTSIGSNSINVTRLLVERVYDVRGNDAIAIRIYLYWDAFCNINLKIIKIGSFGIKKINIKGELTILLSPLISHSPVVGGIQIFFNDPPHIDFECMGMANIVDLPYIATTVRSILNKQIASQCVSPNRIAMSLDPSIDPIELKFPVPLGLLRVTFVRCERLWSADWGFIKENPSDPYVYATLGAQLFRSKVVYDNNNPVWDETVDFMVLDPEKQHIRVCVYDWDRMKTDDLLASLSISVSDIIQLAVSHQNTHTHAHTHIQPNINKNAVKENETSEYVNSTCDGSVHTHTHTHSSEYRRLKLRERSCHESHTSYEN
eukprot:GHVR01021205.1.p1 GENE.GHVR01021205.1~~GHVR01021205.1.p1  ORF type:complete len:351 (-),score=94.48 GHVR01021205.1:37-1089(-)